MADYPNLYSRTLLKDTDWAVIEDIVCLVTDFTPLAKVENGRVVSRHDGLPVLSGPYAFVSLRPGIKTVEVAGFITHKLDFMMLWAAFHQHTDVPNCRMKVVPQTVDSSDDFRPDWLKKTVARFHTYYSRIFNEGGEETLRSVLEDHRESLKSMDRETRLMLQNILFGVEEALLPPEEVWLTWTRNRYRSGVRKALFQRLLPKLVVRVAQRGAFGLLGNRLRADLEGEVSARRLAPHITWTPEVMR